MYKETFVDSTGKAHKLEIRFHRESRMRYRVNSIDDLITDNYKLLIEYIEHHKKRQKPRIQELYDYAEGNNHSISQEQRRSDADMADNRIVHNFGKSISVFKQGYLVGKPIVVEYDDNEEYSSIDETLKEIGRVNNFHNLNRSLVKDLSQVGRAYDLVYRSSDDITKVKRLDPLETFVIYDMSLENNSIVAVRYYSSGIFDNAREFVEFYSSDRIVRFENKEGSLIELETHPHVFSTIPITEYLNNEQGLGDYETELSLIDSYDAVESDTANYMTDTSDAILAIIGDIEFPPDVANDSAKQIEYMRRMRRARLLQIKPPTDLQGNDKNVDAKYLYKQYDVSGVEAYKSRIVNDIHKFTNTPDMTDQNFSGVQSGEAMKYKLFGLEQERVDTQAIFEKSLRRRYKLIASVGQYVQELVDFDISKLKITFNPNLPKVMKEVIDSFTALGGMISNETAMAITGIVENPKGEIAKLEENNKQEPAYDIEEPQEALSKNMYKITSILAKYKKGDISRGVAIKLFNQIGIDEIGASEYLDEGLMDEAGFGKL